MSSFATPAPARMGRKRPLGVTLLAIAFLWIGVGGTLFYPLLIFTGAFSPAAQLLAGRLAQSERWIRIDAGLIAGATFIFYLLYAAIGFGLWKLRNGARRAVMIVTCLFPVLGLIIAADFRQNVWIRMASIAWCTTCGFWLFWYLKRPRVRYAFRAWPAGEGAPPPPGLTTWGQIATGVLAGTTTIGLFIFSLMTGIDRDFASMDVYQGATRRVQSSPCAAALVGSNIAPGWLTTGETSIGNEEGSANLEIPIRGSKGKGTLSLVATKHEGSWTYNSLILSNGDGQVNLATPGAPCSP